MLTITVALVSAGCSPQGGSATPPATGASPSAGASPSSEPSGPGVVVLVGTIITMAEPARAEAIALAGGTVVAIGSRAEVLAMAGTNARIIDLGTNVAYPGFVDAHSHWIGDRGQMGLDTPEQAMEAAVSRGWTSISEQWVDQARLDELQRLADAKELRLNVDGYLALNLPAPSGEHLGDWYASHEPGPRGDRLRVKGVKITLDNGWGSQVWWQPDELAATIDRADQAGWQVAIHTVSTEAHEMVLDAYEATLGGGPNPLHHRIEHAIQVTDEQLARMAALDLATVIHLDGGAADWVLEADYLGNLGEDTAWLARWRDFVEAGLHVAAAVDAPWIFPGFELTADIGRPVDQIAGGMDGRGRANAEIPAWVPAQTLTAEQGLRAVTIDAAWALGHEQRRGHLAPGTNADITILSGDVLAATPDEIRNLAVVATVVGGVTEFCSIPEMCP